VLAAGILAIAGWWRPGGGDEPTSGEPVLDPLCGSGTLVIEAATIAAGMAPGLWRARRQAHGFHRFRDCDRDLAARLVAELEARVRVPAGAFAASDLDPRAVAAARACAEAAGVADAVTIAQRHFEETRPAGGPGLVVTNPPYGERLPLPRAGALFRRLGDWLVRHCGGWRAAILAADTPAVGHLGLRPERRVPLMNGSIACRLVELRLQDRAPPTPHQVAGRGNSDHASAGPTAAPVHPGPAAASRDRGEDAEPMAPRHERGNSHRPGADGASDVVLSPGGATDASAAHRPGHARARTTADQIGDFRRRLAKRFKHLAKWARRQGIEAFRVYDRDIPEIPLVIDWYAGWLHAAEYDRPHERTEIEHEVWLDRIVEAAAAELGVPPDRTFLKARRRQRGGGQYEKVSERQALVTVREAGLAFECNLSDYVDTGLFLDHRITRGLVRDEAAGKRFLNLFCYTGAFSVYAAAGGAAATTSLDLSNTYLDWTRTNLARNGFKDAGRHRTVRDEARAFLEHRARRGEEPFDLVVCDPPTYSRSAKSAAPWDVEQDHAELLELVARNLAPGGIVYFSTNFRRFHLAEERLAATYAIREITRRTIPEDFRDERIHRAWRLAVHGKV
jgi:23S rRNA (guanine2445-N2)-methyltransferase / 23S rRNA (guanine2069-N7)-methyltransferase